MFSLPDLGEGLHEAEIVSWHVVPGDHIVTGQPLVSVETDKAVVEIPSPHSGHVERLFGKAGDLIEVGDLLVEFSGEDIGDAGAIVGDIPTVQVGSTAPEGTPVTGKRAVKAAPAARALAQRLGIELTEVTGTGPHGVITRADVQNAINASGISARRGEPLRGSRRVMARRMAEAHTEAVPASLTEEADVEDWPEGTDTLIRLIRSVVSACRTEPALNCWYESATDERILHDHLDLGLAVDTPQGLIVPTLRDVERCSPHELPQRLEEINEAVELRRISPEMLRGQTLTLSNFGAIAGLHAAMIVVPPQVAIVGAGRIEPQVVAYKAGTAVRRILPLSLTFDHRAVTGGEAARFIAALVADLESEKREVVGS